MWLPPHTPGQTSRQLWQSKSQLLSALPPPWRNWSTPTSTSTTYPHRPPLTPPKPQLPHHQHPHPPPLPPPPPPPPPTSTQIIILCISIIPCSSTIISCICLEPRRRCEDVEGALVAAAVPVATPQLTPVFEDFRILVATSPDPVSKLINQLPRSCLQTSGQDFGAPLIFSKNMSAVLLLNVCAYLVVVISLSLFCHRFSSCLSPSIEHENAVSLSS